MNYTGLNSGFIHTVPRRPINLSGIPFDPATDDPFTTFSNIVLFDNRQNNIGLEEVDGVDVQASTVMETSSGDWSVGFNGTYYLDFTRNFTVTSPPVIHFNRPGRPVDLKFRVHIGWSRSAWNVNAFANYSDSYYDTLAGTPTKIASWTTVDLTLRYDASHITDSGILNGLNMTLGIDNVFDEDPPVFLNNIFGLGFDGVNSNPVGRYVSLRLSKRW
jgi:outer membrane receptor protein involved in Fe transport